MNGAVALTVDTLQLDGERIIVTATAPNGDTMRLHVTPADAPTIGQTIDLHIKPHTTPHTRGAS